MMRIFSILFLTISIFILSCSVSDEEHSYILKIDHLEQALDSVSEKYLETDTAELIQAYQSITNDLSRLSKTDKIFNDSIKIYAGLQKSFKRFIEEHSLIIQEIDYSKNQLKTLKKDISKGKIPEENLEKYYIDEMEAVGSLISKMEYNGQSIRYQLQSYDALHDPINLMINRFEEK